MAIPPIVIIGIERLTEKLVRIQVGIQPVGERSMLEAIEYIHQETPAYPVRPPASTYVRTGTLGRSVHGMRGDAEGSLSRVERGLGSDVVGFVGTNIEYAPWVISEDKQAKMHRGRWWTLQGVVRKSWAGVRRIFERNYSRLVSD